MTIMQALKLKRFEFIYMKKKKSVIYIFATEMICHILSVLHYAVLILVNGG